MVELSLDPKSKMKLNATIRNEIQSKLKTNSIGTEFRSEIEIEIKIPLNLN